jgi:PAS domain S-box-containing protein
MASLPAQTTADVATTRYRVLLVDDDPALIAGLERALRKYPYDVLGAESPAAALELLRSQLVHVVVSDYEMPGMSGSELLARVREEWPDTVRIMLTGQPSVRGVMEAINTSAVHRFFRKPCSGLEIASSIREMLRERSLSSALGQSTAPVVLSMLGTGQVVEGNAAFRELTGLGPDELATAAIHELIEGFRLEPDPRWREAGMQAEPLVSAGRLRGRDGRILEVELSSRVASPGGQIVCTLVTDVTERRRLEDQVVNLQRVDGMGALTAGVTHDFRNLLTVIKAQAMLLRSELGAGHAGMRRLETIEKTASVGQTMIERLLGFARTGAQESTAVEVDAALAAMTSLLTQIVGKMLTLEIRPGAGDARIQAGAGRLEQILVNLVTNARDATPTGGRITVETTTRTGADGAREAVLTVSDTGSGMPPEVRARIFEPLYTTKSNRAGTGLGLSTVQLIVRQLAGTIAVDSEPGRGTTFTISLPCAS